MAIMLLSSCLHTKNTPHQQSPMSLQAMAYKIPLRYFEVVRDFKGLIEMDSITTTQQFMEKYSRVDSSTSTPKITNAMNYGEPEGDFEIFQISATLLYLNVRAVDNVTGSSYLSFFTLHNQGLKEVTDDVFPGVSFSDFYQCPFSQDSLNRASDYYFYTEFYKKNGDTFLRVTYDEPSDYYEEAIGPIGYDPSCISSDTFTYQLKGGRFIKAETKMAH